MIETFIKALSEKCLQVILQSARKTAINITSNTIYIRILTYYITLHLTKNFGVVQQSRQAKFNIYTPPTLAGFFFCLASAEGAGLFVLPCYNTTQYKRLQRVLYRPWSYTARTAKRRTGLYRRFSWDLPHSTATNTRPTQAAIIPPAPHWGVSQRRNTSSIYQIPAPRRTLHKAAQPPYYNKVYKGAAYRRPCQPGGVSSCRLRIAGKCWHAVSSTDPAHLLSGQRLHLYRVSPAAGARRAARHHRRLSPQLFSGFRQIANRGQQ